MALSHCEQRASDDLLAALQQLGHALPGASLTHRRTPSAATAAAAAPAAAGPARGGGGGGVSGGVSGGGGAHGSGAHGVSDGGAERGDAEDVDGPIGPENVIAGVPTPPSPVAAARAAAPPQPSAASAAAPPPGADAWDAAAAELCRPGGLEAVAACCARERAMFAPRVVEAALRVLALCVGASRRCRRHLMCCSAAVLSVADVGVWALAAGATEAVVLTRALRVLTLIMRDHELAAVPLPNGSPWDAAGDLQRYLLHSGVVLRLAARFRALREVRTEVSAARLLLLNKCVAFLDALCAVGYVRASRGPAARVPDARCAARVGSLPPPHAPPPRSQALPCRPAADGAEGAEGDEGAERGASQSPLLNAMAETAFAGARCARLRLPAPLPGPHAHNALAQAYSRCCSAFCSLSATPAQRPSRRCRARCCSSRSALCAR